MKVRHNTALELTVPLDQYGEPGSVTWVTAEILDADEVLIQELNIRVADTSNPYPSPTSPGWIDPVQNVAIIRIPAIANRTRDEQTTDARSVSLAITTDAGDQYDVLYYSIVRSVRLVTPANSFITMTAAQAAMGQMLDAAGWESADSDRRLAALEQAYLRLSAIPFQVKRSDLPVDIVQSLINQQNGRFNTTEHLVILPEDWEHLGADAFSRLPKRFVAALRIAQLTEAEEMLRGDTMEQKLKYGIISESIGESSIRLNTRRLITGVSADALQHLRGYIYYDHRIVR